MIHHLLSEAANRRPEAVLLIHRGEQSTYGEVEAASNRLSRMLVDAGVRKGDRVGLLAPNSGRYVVFYYAALKAGAIAVPLHAGSDARTIGKNLQDCAAAGLLAGPGTTERLSEALRQLPELRVLLLPDDEAAVLSPPSGVRLLNESDSRSLDAVAPRESQGSQSDRAMIIYTSGSTGRPRGATLSHLNLLANTRSIVSYLDLKAEDRVSVVLPFPYVYGKSLLNTHVAVGGSLLLHDGLLFPNAVLDGMEAEEVTGFSGVPSTFAILLHRSDLARRSLPSLRYVTQAGGGMPVPHIRKLMAALPGTRIFVMYGATEAGARLSYVPPEDLPRKLGSIGVAIPGVGLTVRHPEGREAVTGETGEITARGENIMEGYWGDPEATREVLDEHGFHTGDLGWRDEDGYLWLAGRSREMIKSGAHRISPQEIEEVLLELPEIEEAAVVGRPDEYLGEAVVAHVTLRPGSTADPDTLRAGCRGHLPDHKIPAEVRVRRSMPRTPSGKIDKKALRKQSAG